MLCARSHNVSGATSVTYFIMDGNKKLCSFIENIAPDLITLSIESHGLFTPESVTRKALVLSSHIASRYKAEQEGDNSTPIPVKVDLDPLSSNPHEIEIGEALKMSLCSVEIGHLEIYFGQKPAYTFEPPKYN